VAKVLTGLALLIAVAALALAVAALREVRQADEPPTYAEITASGVHEFLAAGNQMTPAQVLGLLGKPDEVYRDNPRALCWRYTAPFEIRMCWGPKRRQAWIATNTPRELVGFEQRLQR
jgi:hypothetical protein